MKDLIINYNAFNSWYHLTGSEFYNLQCIKILNQVAKMSEQRQNFFNNHTKNAVYALN